MMHEIGRGCMFERETKQTPKKRKRERSKRGEEVEEKKKSRNYDRHKTLNSKIITIEKSI